MQGEFGNIDDTRLVFELNRRLISLMVADVAAETHRRLDDLAPLTSNHIRTADRGMVGFSPQMEREVRLLRSFLYSRVYRHERVMRIMHDAERIVEDLVRHFLHHPQDLPVEWRNRKVCVDIRLCAGRIRDFVAGMTDRYAIDLHRSLFDVTPKLR
jgi:dGTPase